MSRKTAGFTLLEVMVVVGIIGILSSVLFINFSESGEQSRDAQRQADLRQLQSAIELYKNRHGRYPEGCNGTGWSGEPSMPAGTKCSDNKAYVIDLAPEFISVLPVDPKPNASEPKSGYAYRVNAEGTVYKVVALHSVEDEEVGYGHSFRLCDIGGGGVCDDTHNSFNHCDVSKEVFKRSYAVWGGFPYEPRPNVSGREEEEQENVICSIP